MITLSALLGIGIIAAGIYLFPILGTLAFLVCVVVIWILRIRQGEYKRGWLELVKSLFFDW